MGVRHVDLSTDNAMGGPGLVDSERDLVTVLRRGSAGCGYGEPEVCLRGGKIFAPRLEEGR